MSDEKKIEIDLETEEPEEDEEEINLEDFSEDELKAANEQMREYWENAFTPDVADLEKKIHALASDNAFMSKFITRILKEVE
tara:strand:- start:5472 stop:5717 length:246 start_codon:yes stop_codon:yes gene_type:complete